MAMSDIDLLFGVSTAGGADQDSESLIASQLQTIINNINRNPLKIKVGLDSEGTSAMLSSGIKSILADLNSKSDFGITINRVELGSTAVASIQNAIRNAYKSAGASGLSVGTDGNVSVGSIDSVTDAAKRTTQAAADASAKLENLDHSLDGNSAAQRLNEIAGLLTQISTSVSGVEKSLASIGSGGGVQPVINQLAELKDLVTQINGKNFDINLSVSNGRSVSQKTAELKAYRQQLEAEAGVLSEAAALANKIGVRGNLAGGLFDVQKIVSEANSTTSKTSLNSMIGIMDTLTKWRDIYVDYVRTSGGVDTTKLDSLIARAQEAQKAYSEVVSGGTTSSAAADALAGMNTGLDLVKTLCSGVSGQFDSLHEQIKSVFDFTDLNPDLSNIKKLTDDIYSYFETLKNKLSALGIDASILNKSGTGAFTSSGTSSTTDSNTFRYSPTLLGVDKDNLAHDLKTEFGISDSGIADIQKRIEQLGDSSIQIDKIGASFLNLGRDVDRVVKIVVNGTDTMGNKIKSTLSYDKTTGYISGQNTDVSYNYASARAAAAKEQLRQETAAAKEQLQQETSSWKAYQVGADEELKKRAEINKAIDEHNAKIAAEEQAVLSATQAEIAAYDELEKKRVNALYDRYNNLSDQSLNYLNKAYTYSPDSAEYAQNMKLAQQYSQEASQVIKILGQNYGEAAYQSDRFSDTLLESKARTEAAKEATKEYQKAQKLLQETLTSGSNAQKSASGRIAEVRANLEEHLQEWTASKYGSTELYYRNISGQISALDSLSEKLATGKMTVTEFNNEFSRIVDTSQHYVQGIRDAGEATISFDDRLSKLTKVFASLFTAQRVFNMIVQGLKKMANAAIELDDALTQLQVVTRRNDSTLKEYASSVFDTATELGSSVSGLIDSATTFARLGYSLEESSIFAKYTAMLENVGDIDTSAAQDALTAIIKAYDLGVDDIETIMDKLVVTGNNFPVSPAQLAEGLNNAASALAAAGNNFDQSLALLTAANTTIQNASKSSTGLRTIAARIRNTKTELDDLGETMTEANYEELVNSLTDYNVALMDTNGEYRSTYDIMSDIAAIWDKMTSGEQAALATAMSGTKQQAVFYSLIEQFKEASGAMDAMSNSAGTLEKSYDIYLNSTTAHIEQMKAAFQSLSGTAIDADFISDLADLGTGVLKLLNLIAQLTDKMGGLTTVIQLLVILFGLFKFRTLTRDTELFGRSLGELRETLKGTAVGSWSLQTALSAVLLVVGLVVMAISAVTRELEEAREAAKDATSETVSSVDSLNDYRDRILALKESLDSNTLSEKEAYDVRQELISINSELIDAYGDEAKAIDAVGDSAAETTRKLDNMIKSQAQTTLTEQYTEIAKAVGKMEDTRNWGSGYLSEYWHAEEGAELHNEVVKRVKEIYEEAFGDGIEIFDNGLALEYELDVDARGAIEGFTAVSKLMDEYERELAQNGININDVLFGQSGNGSWRTGISGAMEDAQAVIDKWGDIYDNAIQLKIAATDDYASIMNSLTEVKEAYNDAVSGTYDSDLDRAAAVQSAIDKIAEVRALLGDTTFLPDDTGVKTYIESLINDFEDAAGSEEFKIDITADLNEKTVSDSFAKVKDAIEVFRDSEDGKIDMYAVLNGEFSDAEEELNAYNALKEAADSYRVSVEELLNILTQYGYIVDTVAEEIEAMSKTDTVSTLMKSQRESITSLYQNIDKLTEAYDKLRAGSLSVSDALSLMEDFPDLAEYIDLTAEGFGNLEEGLRKAIKNSPKALIKTLKEFKETNKLTEAAANYIDDLCDSLEDIESDKIERLTEKFGLLAEAEQKAGKELSELDKVLSEDDYDTNYDKRVESFEEMRKLFKAGAYGSKEYKGYTEYFGIDTLSLEEQKAWINNNVKFFKDRTDDLNRLGVDNFLNTVHKLGQAGKELDGLASYDDGILWIDNTQLDLIAEKLGWTVGTLSDFLDLIRYYSTQAGYTGDSFFNEALMGGHIAYGENGYIADINALSEAYGMTTDEVRAYIDAANEARSADKLSQEELDGLRAKALEAAEAINKIATGNVDHTKRPVVSGDEMRNAGWDFDGQAATIYTSSYDITDSAGNARTVTVTPILDNGKVLTPEELDNYVSEVLDGSNIINADRLDGYGIVVNVADSIEGAEEFENKIQGYKDAYISAVDEIYYYSPDGITLLDSSLLKDWDGYTEGISKYGDEAMELLDALRAVGLSMSDMHDLIDDSGEFDKILAPLLRQIGWADDDLDELYEKIYGIAHDDALSIDLKISGINADSAISEITSFLNDLNIGVNLDDDEGILTISQATIDGLKDAGASLESIESFIQALSGREDIEIPLDLKIGNRTVEQLLEGIEVEDRVLNYEVNVTPEEYANLLEGSEVDVTVNADSTSFWVDASKMTDWIDEIEKDHTVKVTDQTRSVRTSLQKIKNDLKDIDKTHKIKITLSTSGISFDLSKDSKGSKNTTSKSTDSGSDSSGKIGVNARGTRNFEGGPALLGDEYSPSGAPKPELVVQNGTAHIAGKNGPVIETLSPGAVIYSHDETKKILGSSDADLFPAFEGGKDAGGYQFGISSPAHVSVSVSVDDSSLEDKLKDTIEKLQKAFEEAIGNYEHTIWKLQREEADPSEIIAVYRKMQERVNAEIKKYRDLGFNDNYDYIQELEEQWYDYKDDIVSTLEDMVSEANSVLDGFQDVYTTLTDAAKEYASTGYLSVDSLQSIMELGPQYLEFLYDENGQLKINEQSLQKVIAARTEEAAAETALAYAKQILIAVQDKDINTLRSLTDVTYSTSTATWELSYATVAMAKSIGVANGMSESYFDNAVAYIRRLQSLSKTAVNSISAYYQTLSDSYVSQADALDTILELTQDMIKWENEQQIDALENEKDLYGDIISRKKEILQLTKEENDHESDVAEKLRKIAKLQAQIEQLTLDDSREALAERRKLEEELRELQKGLTDDQADYAYNAQIDSLDKQQDAFEDSKDKEIEALKNMLNSAEKLYQAAIARINQGWGALYSDLSQWNYNYGSTLQSELVAAWEAASQAVQRYGSFVSALEGVKSYTDLGDYSGSEGGAESADIINRMRQNSLNWYTASSSQQASLNSENASLAKQLSSILGTSVTLSNGSWMANGSAIYSLGKDEVASAIVSAMKQNAAAWHSTSDTATRNSLASLNEELAQRLSRFLGQSITKSNGDWYIGGRRLFDVYHKGGIVGGSTLKQDEVLAVLQKGEAVLDEKREKGLYRVVDFVQILSDRLGRSIDMSAFDLTAQRLNAISSNIGTSPTDNITGHYSFAPVVNVNISHEGKLTDSDARRYGDIAAETVLDKLSSAFTRRGITNIGSAMLK